MSFRLIECARHAHGRADWVHSRHTEDLLLAGAAPWIKNIVGVEFLQLLLFNEAALMAESLISQILPTVVAHFSLANRCGHVFLFPKPEDL